MIHFTSFLGTNIETLDVSTISKENRDSLEADSFWCLSKFLDGIQDNYIFAQLGIQYKVNQLKELIQRIDGKGFYSIQNIFSKLFLIIILLVKEMKNLL